MLTFPVVKGLVVSRGGSGLVNAGSLKAMAEKARWD